MFSHLLKWILSAFPGHVVVVLWWTRTVLIIHITAGTSVTFHFPLQTDSRIILLTLWCPLVGSQQSPSCWVSAADRMPKKTSWKEESGFGFCFYPRSLSCIGHGCVVRCGHHGGGGGGASGRAEVPEEEAQGRESAEEGRRVISLQGPALHCFST